MATRNYSTRADSRKRTALGDISNNGGAKPNGAKKALVASTDVRPTPPVAESQKAARSSFGRGGRAIAHVDIDAADVNDPQAETSYVNDIYAHFRATEGTFYSRFGCLCWETFFFCFFFFTLFFNSQTHLVHFFFTLSFTSPFFSRLPRPDRQLHVVPERHQREDEIHSHGLAC